MEEFPLFSPEEARARLPALRPLLAQLREAFHDWRFAHQQAEELRRMDGEALDDPAHPDHAEHHTWRAKEADLARRVQGLVRAVNDLGADVKDPLLGLVDFHHRRRDGELVLLCYRDDEADLAYWHPLDAGFGGRRPLRDLERHGDASSR